MRWFWDQFGIFWGVGVERGKKRNLNLLGCYSILTLKPILVIPDTWGVVKFNVNPWELLLSKSVHCELPVTTKAKYLGLKEL